MVHICAVVGCSSRAGRDPVSFHSFPSIVRHKGKIIEELSKERRRRWLASINRADLHIDRLKHYKVCSKHFILGKPSKLYNKNDPDFIPTLHMRGCARKGKKGRRGCGHTGKKGRKVARVGLCYDRTQVQNKKQHSEGNCELYVNHVAENCKKEVDLDEENCEEVTECLKVFYNTILDQNIKQHSEENYEIDINQVAENIKKEVDLDAENCDEVTECSKAFYNTILVQNMEQHPEGNYEIDVNQVAENCKKEVDLDAENCEIKVDPDAPTLDSNKTSCDVFVMTDLTMRDIDLTESELVKRDRDIFELREKLRNLEKRGFSGEIIIGY